LGGWENSDTKGAWAGTGKFLVKAVLWFRYTGETEQNGRPQAICWRRKIFWREVKFAFAPNSYMDICMDIDGGIAVERRLQRCAAPAQEEEKNK